MTVGNVEKPSLLTALLAKEAQDNTNVKSGDRKDGLFADKLDKFLTVDAKDSQTREARARSLAESLNLQMLQTTLSMSGDQPVEPVTNPLFGRQSASIKALIDAYGANQPNSSTQPVQQATPSQPLPDADLSTQSVVKSYSSSLKPDKGGQWLDPLIAQASSRYGVDAGLIKAVIKAESGFNPNAVSHAGAQGLMQLMPGTARSLGVTDSFDPEQNVMGGTRFLRDLLSRYNGDVDSALAAYNWGPGNVDKRPDRLPRETRDYLVRVKQLYSSYTA